MSKQKELSRRELLALGSTAGAGLLLTNSMGTHVANAAKKRLPRVPRRVLGKTGKTIPILLVGGAVKLDPVFDPKLAEALRYGVNYIDAADCYSGGACEPAVASFLTRAKARPKVWITSKSDEHEPEPFRKTVEESLMRLQTSYINLYFLHALKDPKYLNPALLKVVEKLKREGKIRFFGFSCHDGNVAELLNLASKLPWIDAVMFRYNFRRYGDKELNRAIDACARANVGLIAMKTQGSEASFRTRWEPFKQTGKWNKHQAVLKAVWADERISAAVSHMDTLEKMRENIAAAVDRTSLSQQESQELRRYAEDTRSASCDGCDHLCSAAVDAPVQIGDTMRYLMYHDVYGEQEKARALFSRLPTPARELSCVDFRPASKLCPNGIDIAWHMRRAAKVLG